MDGEKYYIGSDLKFKIDISAPGFSQERDNYDIDFYCGDTLLRFDQDDVIQSGDCFYLPIATSSLASGKMKMVITAYVPDTDFDDNVRKEVAVYNLGMLKGV
jgi:hypothetical protein